MADESGMSAMEYYYHTIGRIVGYLSNKGLGRFDLNQSNSIRLGKSPEQAVDALQDCIGWLQKEGLIWCGKTIRCSSDKITVKDVQLTAKGMSAIRADTSRGQSIQVLVEDSSDTDLDPETYTMIGDRVVEFAGTGRGPLQLGGEFSWGQEHMNFAIVLVDRMVTFMAVTTLVLAVATIVVTLIW